MTVDRDSKKKDDIPNDEDEEMKDAKEEEKAPPKEPKKKKYTDWPLKDIKEPHAHDVLYGRGGGTNHHPGNKRYRKMVEKRKMDYVNSKRLDKPLVALEIIRQWRDQDPPGRFLKVDEKTSLWFDVGDKKAREKTSQALREKAPLLRKQQEEELNAAASDEDGNKATEKTTRFAEDTNKQKKAGPKKAVLARDHSLGREYIVAGDAVTLDGFSWQDPLQEVYPGRSVSQGSMPDGSQAPPSPGYYPPGRMNSQGSMGVAHPNYHQSHGPGGYPSHYRSMSEDRHSQYTSSGRYESWGQPMSSMGSNGPPMPPPRVPGYGDPYIQRSGSWGPSGGSWGPPGGSWGPPPPMPRDHSLSHNPLRDATTSQAAMPGAFEPGRSGSGSGYWGEIPPVPQPHRGGPPLQQYHPPGAFDNRSSSGSSPSRSSPSRTAPPPYSVDPAIAQTWSAQSDEYETASTGVIHYGVQRTWSGEEYGRRESQRSSGYGGGGGGASSPSKQTHDESGSPNKLSRPHIVKRATSNQNETAETKPDLRGPSVKRAALNRDNSLVSNRLKAQYLNGNMYKTPAFDTEKEVRNLSGTLAEASLDVSPTVIKTRPKPLSASERTSTIDKIAMDLMTQPEPLGMRNRSSTIEALALDFDDDQIARPGLDRGTSTNSLGILSKDQKPAALTAEGRITTMDLMDLVNAPLDGDEEPLDRPELNRDVSVSEWLNVDV